MITHQQKKDLMAAKYDRKNPRDLSKFTTKERRLVAEHLGMCKDVRKRLEYSFRTLREMLLGSTVNERGPTYAAAFLHIFFKTQIIKLQGERIEYIINAPPIRAIFLRKCDISIAIVSGVSAFQ